jgi:hypothetical protein
MAERKVKVPLPTGQVAEGSEVSIDTSTDRFCDVQLEDGTVFRIKPNIISVVRVDNQYDAEGNPLYLIKSNAIINLVTVPDHLHDPRRKQLN